MKLEASDPLLHPQYRELLHGESQFIEHFYNLITESINPPYAISIDGLWGTGKTTVMRLLQNRLDPGYKITSNTIIKLNDSGINSSIGEKLKPFQDQGFKYERDLICVLKEILGEDEVEENKEKLLQYSKIETVNNPQYPTFWFNPWEYQDAKSIVLAFLQRFAAEMLKGRENFKNILKILGFLGYLTLDTALTGIPAKFLSIFKNLGSIEESKKKYNDFLDFFNKFSKKYETYNDLIDIIKEDFRTLVNKVYQDHDKRPVIVFFDDLDRCLPDKTIELLEAIKNLFVVADTKVIFICGIDTHIAKQFIIQHYKDIEEEFAVNYFRKIFNLTIHIPFNPKNLEIFLDEHIQQLYGRKDDQVEPLSKIIAELGINANLTSLRKYLSIIDNLYVLNIFKKAYTFDFDSYTDFMKRKESLMIVLLVFKQAWPLLYDDFTKEAFKNDRKSLMEISNFFINPPDSNEQQPLSKSRLNRTQQDFFLKYLQNRDFKFYLENLCDWLKLNPVF